MADSSYLYHLVLYQLDVIINFPSYIHPYTTFSESLTFHDIHYPSQFPHPVIFLLYVVILVT